MRNDAAYGRTGQEFGPVCAGFCAVGAGVVAPGVAGGGVAGFDPGRATYDVQKCRPHLLHTQNCCGVHGCPGAGSRISICSPHR